MFSRSHLWSHFFGFYTKNSQNIRKAANFSVCGNDFDLFEPPKTAPNPVSVSSARGGRVSDMREKSICCSRTKTRQRSSGGAGLIHFPSAFNSSPVLPPCLRRRSTILVFLTWMAKSSGVWPPLTFAFTSAPSAISSSTISLGPTKAA